MGKLIDCSLSSVDARERRSDMAAGGRERPAKSIGPEGSGGAGDDEALMAKPVGGSWGDKGGGEELTIEPEGSSTAFPIPLSTLGPSLSSLKRTWDFSSLGAPSARSEAFLWMSLNFCAMRSEMVAVLTGLSRGWRRGEVVYLSVSSLFGANLALQLGVSLSRRVSEKFMYSLLLSLIRLANFRKIRVFQFDDLHQNDSA